MTLNQIQSLNDEELSLILYLFNVLEPIKPGPEITVDLLPYIKPDALLWKLASIESKLNIRGKEVFHSLMTKLNVHPIQQAADFRNDPNQLSFNF